MNFERIMIFVLLDLYLEMSVEQDKDVRVVQAKIGDKVKARIKEYHPDLDVDSVMDDLLKQLFGQ